MKISNVVFLCGLLLLVGCGNKSPITVEAYERPSGFANGAGAPIPAIRITATENSVIIKDVIGNRGNCKVFRKQSHVPVELKFGESTSLMFENLCRVSEVEIVTDQGSWTFNLN